MTKIKSYIVESSFLTKRSIKLASTEQNNHFILEHLKQVDEYFKPSTAKFLKKGNSSTVIKIISYQKTFAIRRDNPVTFLKFIKRAFKKSRSKKAWEKAVFLSSTNLKTLSPFALIEDHLFFFRIRSFFISFFINGKTLKNLLENPDITYDKKKQIADKIIDTILQWHGLGITHGDPKLTNIIIQNDEIHLIDTEDVKTLKNKHLKLHAISRDWSIIIHNFYQQPQIRQKLVKKISLSFNQGLNYFTKVLIKKFLKQKPLFFTSSFLTKKYKPDLSKLLNLELPVGFQWVDIGKHSCAAFSKKDLIYVIISRQSSIFQNSFLAMGQNPKKGIFSTAMYMNICGFALPQIINGGISSNKEYLIFIPPQKNTFNKAWDKIKNDQKKRIQILTELGSETGRFHAMGFLYGEPDLTNIYVKKDYNNTSIGFSPKASIQWYKHLKHKTISKESNLLIQKLSLIVPKKDLTFFLNAYEKSFKKK